MSPDRRLRSTFDEAGALYQGARPTTRPRCSRTWSLSQGSNHPGTFEGWERPAGAPRPDGRLTRHRSAVLTLGRRL